MTHAVRRDDAAHRYELWVDGERVGIADFRVDGDRVVMPHTVIEPARRGHGLGALLVAGALADIRAQGRTVVPECWYVAEYLELHPEDRDLLAGPSPLAVARDIVDDRLLGALHVRALNRRGFVHDPATEHTAFQAGTLDGLMQGRFDGDATIGEILEHGDLGIGTVQHLGGELVIIDGEAFVIDGDGVVSSVAPETPTPFAVVCRFSPLASACVINGPVPMAAVREELDALAPHTSVLAVRVEGEFTNLRLRSVRAQQPPYPTLAEVTAHQTEWSIERATGVLVGFRFPDGTAGLEVPGYHLHFLADDRSAGGHVLDLTMTRGTAFVDGGDELHVELPAGVDLGTPGIADRAAIHQVEGG